MNFEEFKNQARLFVLGALENSEVAEFEKVRAELGERAEEFISECEKLNSVFALSLRPRAPHPETRRRLLETIRKSLTGGGSEDNGA